MTKAHTVSMRQLPLALPQIPPRFDRDAFVRAESNEGAWRTAAAWLAAGEPVLVICGPAGAGKTHLAHALTEAADAAFMDAGQFVNALGNPLRSAARLCVIDPMFALGPAPGPALDEGPAEDPHAFLTALETAIGAGARIILAGQGRPSNWAGGLKDLRTRLEAAPRAVLSEPDETLIRAVIAKGFADRQIAVNPAVIEYAAPRLPLTFAAAHGFVALADQTAMEEKRKITTPFVQKLLDNLSEGDQTS